MSSEQQILNLIGKYTHYMDQADFEKVGELFINGKIISPGSSMEGKEGVASQLKKNLQVYPDGTLRTAHITTNIVLDIQEEKNEATAVSYLTIFQQDRERGLALQPIAVGRYHDIFKQTNDTWHFSVRELIITLAGDLSHHAMPGTIDPESIENNG
ncbi:nuclear transport factor 2 family protein [Pontibacter harenae]|uniref:nuclear transport factor 2 family protein n=1 Tax=Pontibacter harenae TaxID=2894083 RepID=UPI001E3B1EF6|nr:nuclear transport factor 2 family protein [Pontibacter harenae]MCC9168881.1 nuclear transport factor 2 family protein [Pontibacter harenae]